MVSYIAQLKHLVTNCGANCQLGIYAVLSDPLFAVRKLGVRYNFLALVQDGTTAL